VAICAQAVADHLKEKGMAARGLVIGYDTRFASEDFAACCAGVAAGNGLKVYLSSKAIPTPEVSFAVVHKHAAAGIVITASHNPAIYNGFKIKSADGASAPTEMINAVEKNIARIFFSKAVKQLNWEKALGSGLVEKSNFDSAYLGHISKMVDLGALKRSGLKIVADSMFGAGSGYFRSLLEGGAVEFSEINAERNPSFPGINPEPITPNLKNLSAAVLSRRAAVGLATDGDSDRIGIMDEKGRFVTQLEVYALLALYLLEVRGQKGAIVKTVTSTSMLYRLGELFDVPVIETPVGFKYVAPIMIEKNALIGGEESGGYGFRGHVPERDAILAGLYFLDFMVQTGKTPSELLEYLFSKVGPHHYSRRDFHFPEEKRQSIISRVEANKPLEIAGSKVAKYDTLDGFRYFLQDGSWLLIRFSGTEPLLRIYAETSSPERVKIMLDFGQDLTGMA
jgi:phosphomannomutase